MGYKSGYALFFTADSTFTIIAGRFVQGFGETPLWALAPALLPTFLMKNSQVNQNSIGWLFIGFYIGISLAQLAGGYLADVKGRFFPIVAGLSIFSLGQIFFPYFSSAIGLGFLSIASFGLGLFFIGAMAALNDYVGNNAKGLISGIFYLFWGTGYFLGPLIFGYAGEHGRYILGFTCL
jgi:MFS family permease